MTTTATAMTSKTVTSETMTFEQADEIARVGAAARLTLMAHNDRDGHLWKLRKAENQARLLLAARIMEMDEADARCAVQKDIHSLNEQARVQAAQEAYGQALANLVRGEE